MSASRDQSSEGLWSGAEPLRRYRVAKYRLALVREATISTTWDKRVREPRDVATFLTPLARGLDREHFWTLLLDGRHTLIGLHLVAIGSLTAAVVHPREVFKAAIAGNAAALVLAHSHPSGDPSPSSEDLALTRRLCEVGDLVGIRVLDHIVLGEAPAFRSLADDGLLGGSR